VRRLIKKVHIYAGLLSFTAFVVYGIAGLHATLLPAPDARPPEAASTREVALDVPGGMTDKQVADLVHATLALPLTSPLPEWALQRDPDGRLRLDFYTPNGIHRVTVLEDEGRLRVDTGRTDLGRFLINLHAMTGVTRSLPLLAWTAYNLLATVSLILMTATGLYLWLASRPSHRPARLSLVTGSAVFLALVFWIW